jgi:hypothetical protein
VFLKFYRAIYTAVALFVGVSEYRKDGNLLEAAAFAVLIAVGLELIYWAERFRTNFPGRCNVWMTRQREKVAEDRLYPNVPLFVALMTAIVCIGMAAAFHLIFPEACDPEAKKWVFRVAYCKQPFRGFFYLSTVALFAMLGASFLIMAFMLRRR